MSRNSRWRVLGAAALALTLFAGCESGGVGKIAVGKVDTAALLQEDTDYQSMSVDYLRDQTDLRQSFVEKLKATDKSEGQVKALQEEYMKAQQGFNDKWKQKTEDFLKTRHDAIQGTAGDIAKRKNIDLVLIDSEMYPTVEWGGVDMTQDMKLALSEGSQHQPKATATPEGAGD